MQSAPPSQAKNHSSSPKQKIIPLYLKKATSPPTCCHRRCGFLALELSPTSLLVWLPTATLYVQHYNWVTFHLSGCTHSLAQGESRCAFQNTARLMSASAAAALPPQHAQIGWPTQMPTSPRFTWIQCNLDVVSVNVKDKSRLFRYLNHSFFFGLFFLPCFDEPLRYCFQFLFWKSKFDEASLTAIKQFINIK